MPKVYTWDDTFNDPEYQTLSTADRLASRDAFLGYATDEARKRGLDVDQVVSEVKSYSEQLDPSLSQQTPQTPVQQQEPYQLAPLPGGRPSQFKIGERYIDKQGRVAQLRKDGQWDLHQVEYDADKSYLTSENLRKYVDMLVPWKLPGIIAKGGPDFQSETTETFRRTDPTDVVLPSFQPEQSMDQFIRDEPGVIEDSTPGNIAMATGVGVGMRSLMAAKAGIQLGAKAGLVEGLSAGTQGLTDIPVGVKGVVDLTGDLLSKAGKNIFKGVPDKKKAAVAFANVLENEVANYADNYTKILADEAAGKTVPAIDPRTNILMSPEETSSVQIGEMLYGGVEQPHLKDAAIDVLRGRVDVGSGNATVAHLATTDGVPSISIPHAEVEALTDAMNKLSPKIRRGRAGSLNIATTDRTFDMIDPNNNSFKKIIKDPLKAMTRIGQSRGLADELITDNMAKALKITSDQSHEMGVALTSLQPGTVHLMKENNPKTYLKFQGTIDGVRAYRKQIEAHNLLNPESPIPITTDMLKPFLSPEQMSFIKFQKSLFEQHHMMGNQSRRLSGLKEMGKIDNYFPFMADYDQVVKGMEGLNPALDKTAGTFAAHEAVFQHAKSRAGGSPMPLMTDAVEATKRYVKHSHKAAAINPMLHKIRKLQAGFMYNEAEGVGVKAFTINGQAPVIDDYLTLLHNDVAGIPDPMNLFRLGPKANKFAKGFTRNMTYNYLSFNARTALVQMSAVVPAIAEIGGTTMAHGAAMSMIPMWRRFAMKNSTDLLVRVPEDAMEKVLRKVGPDAPLLAKFFKLRDAVGDAGMIPVAMLDKQTATAVWLGTYKKSKRLGMKGREPFLAADEAVRRTQASPAGMDVSRLQREGVLKPLTLFQTFAHNQFDQISRDILGFGAGARKLDVFGRPMTGQRRAVQAARLVTGMVFAGAVYGSLGLKSPFPDYIGLAYDEEVQGVGQNAVKAIQEGSELLPGGSSLSYGSNPLGAGVDFLGDVADDFSRGNFPELGRKALGTGLGVPVRGIEKMYNKVGPSVGLKPTKKPYKKTKGKVFGGL